MNTKTQQLHRRGLALVLVLAVLALASVIGFALLSSSTLKAQVNQNATQAASADYVAESAVQAAFYYLQYPSKAPASWTGTAGYEFCASKQSLGSDVPGTFDLQVQKSSKRDEYTIRAVGHAGATSAPRVVTARAEVSRAKIGGAGHFGGPIVIPVRTVVEGQVQSEGSITNNSVSPLLTVKEGPLPETSYKVPVAATTNYYGADLADGKYLCPDGTIGYAQKLTSAPTSSPVAAANNPGKVFYYLNTTTPDLILTSSVTISGTLVIKGGSLFIRAPSVSLNPVTGFPALIVEKDLNMYRNGVGLTANGVVYVGRNLTWTTLLGSNTGSTLTIKGALVMPSGSTLGTPGSGGSAAVQYVGANVNVPDLSRSLQPGMSVKILAWNE